MTITTGAVATRRAVALGLVLGGCSFQVPGQGPGPREFRLSPKSSFPADLPKVRWALAVAEPVAERTLDTARIAVVQDGLAVDYYADAAWIDRAPALLEGLIVQSFVRSGAIATVGSDRDRLKADFLLLTSLRAFQTQGTGGTVRVGLDATLLALPARDAVGTTSITSEAPPATRSLDAVVAAFDDALGEALKQLVVWALRTGQAAPPVG